MARIRAAIALLAASALGVLMTACGNGGTATTPQPSFTLTVDSTGAATGVSITNSPADNNAVASGSTPFTLTYNSGATATLTAPLTASTQGYTFSSWSGCASTSGASKNVCSVTMSSNMTVTAAYTAPVALIAPTVTVTPSTTTMDSQQTLPVTVAVAGPTGDPTPTGSVVVSYGASYTSASMTLSSGSATITIPAGTLPLGSDTLTATYTPDSAGSATYTTATGTSGAVTVEALTTVTVDQTSTGLAVTNQILGVNLEAWYDVVGNAGAVTTALGQAGLQAIRWPGGSWSDAYHWENPNNYLSNGNLPYMCNTTAGDEGQMSWAGYSTFAQFESAIPEAGAGYDLALTANYGSNETCNGGGDPNEAALWAAAAVSDGHPASHITVGNEEYGDWEYDLHSTPNDPTTYADAVIGASGYYDLIKAQSRNTLVGVVVDANCTTSSGCTDGWDSTVLSLAKGSYDFVEYHYYAQYGNVTSDTYLVDTAAQQFTTNINEIKTELATAGEASTPIYVGEVGPNSGNVGTQSWSITDGLYAGQMLGEAMNDGVSRLTWWDGFDNCQGPGNNQPGVYGWQLWGAQNIFSDGPAMDTDCPGDGAIGTLSPAARAFQLFSQVAVTGESVLTAAVSGDTTDVRAYAATHSGGTALVLFNLNATTAEPVEITLSSSTSTSNMSVTTYDKEIYDYSNVNCQADSVSSYTPYPCTYDPTHDYSSAVWAAPTTTNLGTQTLPYTLLLQPWSMNVVIIPQ